MPSPEPTFLDSQSNTDVITFVFHGTRGSIPAPGPATIRHGGNTPSVEVRVGGATKLVLDAGSGIRTLGETLRDPVRLDLFLTHFHWDHIQGLPFFAPLYREATEIRIVGPARSPGELKAMLETQMKEEYFPVSVEEVGADLTFDIATERRVEVDGLAIRALPANHPGRTVGYRIDGPGVSMAYLPDNELGTLDPAARADLAERLRGVDVLIHDAMYREDEYPARRGWGHSTPGQALDLALDAGVHRLFLFHHAPGRSDDELDADCLRAARDAARRSRSLTVETASEGREISLNTEPIS